VSNRHHFDNAYWSTKIGDAKATQKSNSQQRLRLIFVGRTLRNWLKSEFRAAFCEAIRSVLMSGGSVYVITAAPITEEAKDAVKILDDTLESAVKSGMNHKWLANFHRHTIKHTPLTFTLFASTKVVWASPYLSFQDTDSNLAFEAHPDSIVASTLTNDVMNLIQRESRGGSNIVMPTPMAPEGR
jgi:hypothetical protein